MHNLLILANSCNCVSSRLILSINFQIGKTSSSYLAFLVLHTLIMKLFCPSWRYTTKTWTSSISIFDMVPISFSVLCNTNFITFTKYKRSRFIKVNVHVLSRFQDPGQCLALCDTNYFSQAIVNQCGIFRTTLALYLRWKSRITPVLRMFMSVPDLYMINRAPSQYKDRLIYVWRLPC